MPRSGVSDTSSLRFSEDKNTDESDSSTPRGESPGRGTLNTVRSVHQFCASPAFVEDGAVTYETFQRVCGRGFAPWEVHRPQQAVRELLTSGCFTSGAVLDCGCGIGDNSLFIAKYTSCSVDAVDMPSPSSSSFPLTSCESQAAAVHCVC
ncbi:hypothetical protein Agub_g12799 [Astrephomene gubernaculifera]|uniref:Uncharacterized protein n=1 Tax=Astrephomene gubernaculifera TaxID=47775 RepID=A0AAD3E0R1_9CHLO|nr:hypothetical protein Agub_g12799 [Astrephomene gubernaculifera]